MTRLLPLSSVTVLALGQPQLPGDSSMVDLAGFQLLGRARGRAGPALLTHKPSWFQSLLWSRGLAPPVLPGRDTSRARPGAVPAMVLRYGHPGSSWSGQAGSAWFHPTPTGEQDMLSAHPSPAGLTLREAWRVVVDVGDHNGDGGGSGQPPQLPGHVCGTDHHLVAVLCLTVQVCHGGPDHTCKAGQLSTGSSHSHTQAEPGRGHWRFLWTRPRPTQDQLDLPLHTGQMLQYFTHLHGPSLDSLWHTHRITRGVSTALASHQCTAEGTVTSPATALVLPVPQEHTAGHKQHLLSHFGCSYMSKSQLRGEKDTEEKNKPRGLSASQKHPKILPEAQEWPQAQPAPSKSPHEA